MHVKTVREWIKHADPGDVLVYHSGVGAGSRNPDVFSEMRQLSDTGRVMLTQRKVAGVWHWQATAIRLSTADWLATVSRSVPTPGRVYRDAA